MPPGISLSWVWFPPTTSPRLPPAGRLNHRTSVVGELHGDGGICNAVVPERVGTGTNTSGDGAVGIKRETEKSFMGAVTRFAQLHGWLVFHVYDSRRCVPGYPDLTLAKGERLIFAELKVGKNKVTAEQAQWIIALTKTGAEVYEWRPELWEAIERILATGETESGRTRP